VILIPKVFHRVWLGGKPMPEEFVRWGRTWTDLHPGWTMRLWTEADIADPPLQNADLLPRCACLAQQSDLVRYEIMLREGGVYVDTDLECLKNIEPLIDDECGLFVTHVRDCKDRFSNAIFGCVPGHGALAEVVRRLPEHFATEPWFAIGPPYFTDIVSRYEKKVLRRRVFQPLTYTEYGDHRRTVSNVPKGTYAVNHHASAWYKPTTEALPRRA
jgi:inositol phosphorylceramide mannosyltransferase catalytic subunit